jgi:predicted NBD/HSP70 family sugar kinase
VNQNRIGIDLGGSKIEAIIMDGQGEITHRDRVDTPKDNYQQALNAIRGLVEKLEQEAGTAAPLPLGIGTPGAISNKTGLMKNCNSTCLNSMPLQADLETLMSRPVRIANDADCFTLSEASDGAAAGTNNVFGVILGTGVGGGISLNQKPVQGINAIAGEWGHNPLTLENLQSDNGAFPGMPPRTCYCGRRNCVESWLAGPSFELSFEIVSGRKMRAPAIVALVNQGDSDAKMVMDRYHNMLALALSTVINILDPEKIVLGGGLSNITSLYTEMPKYLDRYVFSDRVDTEIVKAKHGDSSGVRGAAWLWPLGET